MGYEIEEAKAKVAKKYAYLALDYKYKTEAFCIDNALTPYERFKENAINEEVITWNIKKSALPFEPEAKDTILPF